MGRATQYLTAKARRNEAVCMPAGLFAWDLHEQYCHPAKYAARFNTSLLVIIKARSHNLVNTSVPWMHAQQYLLIVWYLPAVLIEHRNLLVKRPGILERPQQNVICVLPFCACDITFLLTNYSFAARHSPHNTHHTPPSSHHTPLTTQHPPHTTHHTGQ